MGFPSLRWTVLKALKTLCVKWSLLKRPLISLFVNQPIRGHQSNKDSHVETPPLHRFWLSSDVALSDEISRFYRWPMPIRTQNRDFYKVFWIWCPMENKKITFSDLYNFKILIVIVNYMEFILYMYVHVYGIIGLRETFFKCCL